MRFRQDAGDTTLEKVDTYGALPQVGDDKTLYITKDDNSSYYWEDGSYHELSGGGTRIGNIIIKKIPTFPVDILGEQVIPLPSDAIGVVNLNVLENGVGSQVLFDDYWSFDGNNKSIIISEEANLGLNDTISGRYFIPAASVDGGGSNVTVVQQRGASITSVPSQDFVTKEFVALQTSISNIYQPTANQIAAANNALNPSLTNPYATKSQLPAGKVSLTSILNGDRIYKPVYTDIQYTTVPGDIVDLYYPITAVLPPNTRTVLALDPGVNINLNGQSIGKDVPHDNKAGMLIKSGNAYVNGGGAVIYGFGAEGKAIETADTFGGNGINYSVNNVNIEVADGAIGVHNRLGGVIRHTGDIKVGTGSIGVKTLNTGKYEGSGKLTAYGTSYALFGTQGGSIVYSGKISLLETSTIQLTDANTIINLEQIIIDGQTGRTVGSNLLIKGSAGTKLILTNATILGNTGATVIEADIIEYRGRCYIEGNVVANTTIGSLASEASTIYQANQVAQGSPMGNTLVQLQWLATRSTGPTSGNNIDVYILAGQSNMEGASFQDGNKSFSRVLIYNRSTNSIEPLSINGLTGNNTGENYPNTRLLSPFFGPEDGIATYFEANTLAPTKAVLLKGAYGGASIEDFLVGGQRRPMLESTVVDGLAKLVADGYTPVIKAIFWDQKEGNSGDSTEVYEQKLNQFFNSLSWLPDTAKQVIMLANVGVTANSGSVRQAQLNYISGKTNARYVDPTGRYGYQPSPEDVHYDTPTMRLAGRDYWAALNRSTNSIPGPLTAYVTSPFYDKLVVSSVAYDKLHIYSTSVINGAKATTTSGKSIIYPDGNQFYPNGYVNDGSMAIAARPDLFNATFLEEFVSYFKDNTQTTGQFAYIVPEYISATGVVGMSAQGGVRPSLDRNPYFINLVWELFNRQNAATYYNTHKVFLKELMTTGMSLVDGIPTIADLAFDTPGATPYAQVGFNDSEFISGASIHLLSLYFRALNQLAEMANKAGDTNNEAYYIGRASTIKQFANTNLWDEAYGLYKASTGNAVNQRDVWGSSSAVYYGLATPAIATKISQTLVTKKELWYYQGGGRCIMEDTDDRVGYASWPAYIKGGAAGLGSTGQAQVTDNPTLSIGPNNAFGRYQNGGYWTTYMNLMILTVSITNPTLAAQMFSELADKMVASDGVETFSKDGFSQVPKYTASMGPLAHVERDGTAVEPIIGLHTWALRKRKPEYTGAALRVRRVSDNTEMDINFSGTDGINTSQLTTFLNGTVGKVSKWYDQSGLGNHLVQLLPSYQPTIVLNGINSLPTIEFLELEQLHCPSIWLGPSSRTMTAVYKNLSTNTAVGEDFVSVIGGQRDNGTTPGSWFIMQSRNGYGGIGSPYLAGYAQDIKDLARDTSLSTVGAISYDGNVAAVYTNGVLKDSLEASYNTGAVSDFFVIGNDAVGNQRAHIQISEVTVTDYYSLQVINDETVSMKTHYNVI